MSKRANIQYSARTLQKMTVLNIAIQCDQTNQIKKHEHKLVQRPDAISKHFYKDEFGHLH